MIICNSSLAKIEYENPFHMNDDDAMWRQMWKYKPRAERGKCFVFRCGIIVWKNVRNHHKNPIRSLRPRKFSELWYTYLRRFCENRKTRGCACTPGSRSELLKSDNHQSEKKKAKIRVCIYKIAHYEREINSKYYAYWSRYTQNRHVTLHHSTTLIGH